MLLLCTCAVEGKVGTMPDILENSVADRRIIASESAWAIIYRNANPTTEASHARQQKGKNIRERLVSEYQNNALVNALVLTLTATFVVAPEIPIDVDSEDTRFRLYMYFGAFSTGCCILGLSLSLTLLYQLNMLLDEDVDDFVLLLAQLTPMCGCLIRRCGASPTGLPDILVVLSGLGFVSMVGTICCAVHMLCTATDAWIITVFFALFVYAPFQVIALRMDHWKWKMLQAKTQQSDTLSA